MSDPQKCPKCGAPLAADVHGVLCLRCLLALGLKCEDPEEAAGDSPPGPEDDDFPGYRILGKIGEGGGGIVYRAAQMEPVRREVAVKVIKLGMDTRSVITRFEAERQALALMDHPNIARVFDAGVTGRGRPFFVMELVAGEPITDFCDRKQLTVPQRLELFLQVCEAVRHAHLKGVIHRDLKPSNILVAETDGRPAPKVIDFGVAKAMDHQRLANQTIYTAFDQFVGTPAYMSPEQAGLTGEDIDARSDIYSLGVLLYELLTGRPPFEPERLRKAAIHEICRIIREEDPSLPSARLTTLGEKDLTATAHQRLRPSKRLVSELRGDLDGIVMKALEKSRERRYETTAELAADILRHLRNEPVTARPPGALYRFRKFARRNKLAITAAAVVMASLLGGLALSSWSYLKEKQARGRLEYRAYLTDMKSACGTALHTRSSLAGTINLLEANRRHAPDFRNWEWYFLNGLCHQELLTIPADPKAVFSVSWSSDGKLLATGGAADSIGLWDAASGRKVGELPGHTGGVRCLAWEPSGTRLASAGNGKSVRIRDTTTGESRILGEHGNIVSSLAWSPDGAWLASGSLDKTVTIWDTRKNSAPRTLTAAHPVRALGWHPDGSRLIACGDNGLAHCWDAASGSSRWQHSAEIGGNIQAAVWSPDGRQIFTGGTQPSVDFRNAETGQTTHSLWDNQNTVTAVAWSPDGRLLASGTRYDGYIAIRSSLGAGAPIRSFRSHRGSVNSLAWAPDGSKLASASADGTARIWNPTARNPSIVSLQMPSALILSWSPDGTKLAAGGRRMDSWVYDFTIQAPVALDGGFVPWTRSVAWNAAGTQLATVGERGLRVWDFATRTTAWRDPSSFPQLSTVAWDTRRGRIIAGGNHGFSIWDATTGTILKTVPLKDGAGKLALSPDGRLLAVAGKTVISLFDSVELTRIRSWPAHGETIYSLAWHPAGMRLASGGADTSAKIWDTRNGGILHTLNGHGGPVRHVAWNPDGSRLCTGGSDATVRLWDADTGLEVCVFDKPGSIMQTIQGLAWTPDGHRIAISDGEGNLVILDATPGWQVETGAPVTSFPTRDAGGHRQTIRSLLIYCNTVEPISNNDSDALRRLAWIRATAPYPEVRDGPKALRFAEAANREIGGTNAGMLSILAAAHAECGDFQQAVAIQKQAISLISSDLRRSTFAAQLRLYESHQPCRDDSW